MACGRRAGPGRMAKIGVSMRIDTRTSRMPCRRPRSRSTRPRVARPSTVGDRCGPSVDRHQRDTARPMSFRLRKAARFIASRRCAARCKRRMRGMATSWRASAEGERCRTMPHASAQGKRADDATSSARRRVILPPPQCDAPRREGPLGRQRESRFARARRRIVESSNRRIVESSNGRMVESTNHRRRSGQRERIAAARPDASAPDPVTPRDSARASAHTARAASRRRDRRRARAPRDTASADRRDARGRPSRDRAARP
ncbi:NADH-flavin oxidoreductase/NADH oxidase domain protein [Burkholderia oklahomensis]|uniref:NADH-flavin oxidoreductase/NADH oxidase domain protein n=1 Tax=Burkholderia oklahomensis TaxID=342113 RepID=A0AAI8BD98_9BURK|nr:NADH-flavin oxidoreductase/NADH oxidase domain protein [Burkholderia oklahomensis]